MPRDTMVQRLARLHLEQLHRPPTMLGVGGSEPMERMRCSGRSARQIGYAADRPRVGRQKHLVRGRRPLANRRAQRRLRRAGSLTFC